MQRQRLGSVDQFRRDNPVLRIRTIPELNRGPVFARVLVFHRVEVLDVVARVVGVVGHTFRLARLLLHRLDDFGDIGVQLHVAVGEDSQVFVVAQMGHRRAREGEFIGLLGIAAKW